MSLRILIIGYGSIGQRHAQVLCDLLGNCHIDLVSSKKLPNAYSNLENVPNINSYDYYIIATPTACHFDDLKKLDSAVSSKLIFVEKPLFTKYLEFTSLNKNCFYVGFVLRYHPLMLKAREILKQHKPYFVNIVCESYLPHWRPNIDYRKNYSAIKDKGGGVLLDLSHEVDYAEWLFGGFKNIVGLNCKISELEINSDDVASFTIETQNGIVINFLVNYFSKLSQRYFIAHGNDFTMKVDLQSNTLEFVDKDGNKDCCSISIQRNEIFESMHQDILSPNMTKIAPDLNDSIRLMKTITRMKNMKLTRNNICIIGCRGGSKGVKNKNIREIAGKPLIAHTIQQALSSNLFKHIVLTTDSKEIAEVGKKWGAEVFFLRDPKMATDTAGKLQAIQDALIKSEEYYKEKFDVIVDLDVTSPLRLVEDIIGAYNQFIADDNDNLITACPARKSPYFNLVEIFKQENGVEVVGLSKKLEKQILRRQDSPKCYDMNASIYIFKREFLLSANSIFTKKTGLYVMPEERSVDIDTELDFKFVEFIMSDKEGR